MRISDWSSDVCSSDLLVSRGHLRKHGVIAATRPLPDLLQVFQRLRRIPSFIGCLSCHQYHISIANHTHVEPLSTLASGGVTNSGVGIYFFVPIRTGDIGSSRRYRQIGSAHV